jgi:hypothetical protein
MPHIAVLPAFQTRLICSTPASSLMASFTSSTKLASVVCLHDQLVMDRTATVSSPLSSPFLPRTSSCTFPSSSRPTKPCPILAEQVFTEVAMLNEHYIDGFVKEMLASTMIDG